jgi:siroheme synthase
MIYLVGERPGHPHLITVRGAELFKRVASIIYDNLASPTPLKFASPNAEISRVPKGTGPGSAARKPQAKKQKRTIGIPRPPHYTYQYAFDF